MKCECGECECECECAVAVTREAWAVGLVWQSWEQYAPGAGNYMQIGGRNFSECFQWVARKVGRKGVAATVG